MHADNAVELILQCYVAILLSGAQNTFRLDKKASFSTGDFGSVSQVQYIP